MLRRVVELGINFIDTADAYGPEVSERLIAEALHPYPNDLVIATKGGLTRQGPNEWEPVGRPEYLRQCLEMSLRRLKVERIDLYQLHRIDPKVPAEDTLGALAEMQRAGKIRHVGLSEVTAKEIEAARKILPIVSAQNRIQHRQPEERKDTAILRGESARLHPVVPDGGGSIEIGGAPKAAKKHNATVAQLALAWLLHRSPVMLPIPGTSSVAHLEDNVAAGKLKLTPEELKSLDAA